MADRLTAVVTDNLAFLETYQPFERPPDSQTLYSLIPRGVRRFFFQAATSVKPVNDQMDIFLTATLPENFAYIISKFSYQLVVDTASDWDAEVELRLLNHIPGQPNGIAELISCQAPLKVNATRNDAKTVLSHTVNLAMFTGPFWKADPPLTSGGTPTFRVHHSNTAAAVGGAGFVTSHCEFLEYDLTQAQRYYINTPYPVLTR